MNYLPSPKRYESMSYNRCGKSGLLLPAVSLGLWHNFGGVDSFENARAMIRYAFDRGITHFDLANNYGPPYGSAEETFGRIMRKDLIGYRDELVISTKAGWDMWPGPYGNFGSRKYLIASLEQSLKRLGLEYVDIFYHHRPDPDTPLEETMGALSRIVHTGKALYAGISSYPIRETILAADILHVSGTPCLIHQPSYNMLDRWIEDDLLVTLEDRGIGCIVFSPLAQGVLTNRYLDGIPENSRAVLPHGALDKEDVSEEILIKVRQLNLIAEKRGQSMAQMAIAWNLRHSAITSVLVGASRPAQIGEDIDALNNLKFSEDELGEIDRILEG